MKILILHNGILWKSWDKKIKELKDWWAPELDLDITLERSKFKKIPFVNHGYLDVSMGIESRWYSENIAKPAKARGFDCVMFTVNEKDWATDKRVEGRYSSYIQGIHSIEILGRENAKYDFNGVKYAGDQWFNIARHELSHALYASKRLMDNTHKWWELGNLAEVKKELTAKPTDTRPLVILNRVLKNKNQVTGQLYAVKDGAQFICKTLELADKNNAPNISCIPTGTYKAIWSFSPRFMKYTYEITGVSGRSGIRIHSANYFSQLNGCIALGDNLVDINKDGELDVVNSRRTIDLFNNFMGKKEFILKII